MNGYSVRQLERDLLDALGGHLPGLGFPSRPKGQTFFRPLEGGLAATHLTFIEHEQDLDVTVDVAIRFHSVEELVHRTNKLRSVTGKTETFTLGAELGNLEQGQPYRITVGEQGGVADAVDRIVSKLVTVGLPYIEVYSHPEAAYEVLARDDREAWVHSPIHAERAKRACALLAVLDRHAEIPALGARKLLFLKSLHDPGATAFSSFLSELSK